MRTSGLRRLGGTAGVLALVATLLQLSLLAACSGETSNASPRPGGGFGKGPTAVSSVQPQLRSLEDTFLEREATLLPVATPRISTKQEGFVVELWPEVGDYVHEGDVIARIDDSERKLELAEAEAEIQQSRAELFEKRNDWARTSKLWKQKVISAGERDGVRAELDIAKAKVERDGVRIERAQQALEDVTIQAPSDGIITEQLTERGEYLQRGDGIFIMKDVSAMIAVCTVSERHIGQVDEGGSVYVHVTAYPNRVFQGLIWKIVPDALVNSRSFPIKVLLPNVDLALKPGMSARVSFVRQLDGAVLVPKDAVLREGETSFVLVVTEGFAERREIELGRPIGDAWHVRSGVGPDDEVIVSGNEKLQPGSAVTVVELPPPGPPTVPSMRAADAPDGGAGL
jgi:membrane fusion protein (multidrug efflux system)